MPGVSSFNTRTGAVTLTSGDVATAVGAPTDGQLPVGATADSLFHTVTISGTNCTISISSAGVLTLTNVAKTADTVRNNSATDWTFNGVGGGNSIIFQANGTEMFRANAQGRVQPVGSGGQLYAGNGAEFVGQSRSSSLGGANLNDFAPGIASFMRWSSSAPINVTGLVAATDGSIRFIINSGANAITLTNQDAASAAANRWLTDTGLSVVLTANALAFAIYDGTTGAWRVSLI